MPTRRQASITLPVSAIKPISRACRSAVHPSLRDLSGTG
jgi:hypothetical protein